MELTLRRRADSAPRAHLAPQSETRWSTSLPNQDPSPTVLHALASALLAGEQTTDALLTRADQTLGREWNWLRRVIPRFAATFAHHTRPRLREVVSFLQHDPTLRRAWLRHGRRITAAHWIVGHPAMQPIAAAMSWNVPAIETVERLAEWLRLSPAELDWLADLKTLGRRRKSSAQTQQYHYRLATKTAGDARLIESPKQALKTRQRQILAEILNHVPAHAAVHGFVRQRSIKTFAEPHVGQYVVLRLDLRHFFPSIRRARVQSIFRTLGYPEPVADLLGGLCTNAAPADVFRTLPSETRMDMHRLYGQTHLPQGAPTSPALANLCAYRFDCRLMGLARSAGATYTRYADDLAFSGSGAFSHGLTRFAAHIAAVGEEEGFTTNHRKTRVMRRSVRQHLAGLVVNQRVSVSRAQTDQLKAILTNCVRNGPALENREARPFWREHLLGRIAFVASVHPARGARLAAVFERIDWAR